MWEPQVGIISRPSWLIICCPLVPIFLKIFGLGESWRSLVLERAQTAFHFLRNISACVNLSLPAQFYLLFQGSLYAAYRLEAKLVRPLVTTYP
jgi:hypothetical protein